MEPLYRHTQVSSIASLIVGSLFLILAILLLSPGTPTELIITLLLPFLILVNFVSMAVAVDCEKVAVSLGPGVLRFSYPIENILDCRVVRNSPLNFMGIRWIGNGWLICISGLQAVELELRNGSRARLGTDEPEKLATAIEDALIAARHR